MQAARETPLVRDAKLDDLPALGQIWWELMTFHQQRDPHFTLTHDAMARWLSMAQDMLMREDAFLFKAEADGQAVGFCLGWIATNPPIYANPEIGFISEIAVKSSARRRGIGSALLQRARSWFKAAGLDEFQLSTAVWNEDARTFWEAAGGEPLLVRYRFDS